MKNFAFQFKRLLAVIILLTSFVDATLPVMADTTIFAGDQSTGAAVKDFGGAQLNTATQTANYAQLGITGNGNTITWDHMNVIRGNHLDYNFTANGQVALNKVINGMSTFGGQLTTSGSQGRLIISNPNGILFENGSYTNANSLILTTHDVTWDGYKYGQISLQNNGSLAGIQIGQGGPNAAVMRIADDLNIVAQGIKIDGADILADKNIRLLTADGVTFLASGAINGVTASANPRTYDITNSAGQNITSSILVKDSALAVKDNENGKIYFITKGDSTKENVAAINSVLDGQVKLDVAGNADLEVIGNLSIVDSTVAKDLIAKSVGGDLNLVGNNTVNNTDITTLREYAREKGFLAITADVLDQLFSGKLSLRELTIILGSHLDDTIKSVLTSINHSSETHIAGDPGNVTVSNTNVGGSAKVSGADVKVDGLTANSLETSSVASAGVSYSRNDTKTTTESTTEYAWADTDWYVSPEVGYNTYEVIGSHQETYSYLDFSWSEGIHTHTATRTVDDWGLVYHIISPEGEITYPTAGHFVAGTPTTPTPIANAPDAMDAVNGSYSTNASTGAMNLSNITLKTNDVTTAANTLTASAIGGMTAKNIIAGDTTLTAGGDLKTENASVTGLLKALSNNITLDSTTADSLIAAAAESTDINGDLTSPSTKISVQNGSNFGTVKAYATDIDVTSASQVRGGRLSATQDLKVNTGASLSNLEYAKASRNIEVDSASISNSAIDAGNDLSLSNNGFILGSGSNAATPQVKAGNDIKLESGSFIANAFTSAGRNMSLTTGASLHGSKSNVTGSMSSNNSSINGSTVNADTIDIDGIAANKNIATLNNATLNSTHGVAIDNTDAIGTLTATAQDGNVHLGGVVGVTSIDGLGISHTTNPRTVLTTSNSGNIEIIDSTLGSTNATSAGSLSVLDASTVDSLIASAASISIADSAVTGDADLTSTTGGISINDGSALGSISNANAKTTLDIIGSTVAGNVTASAGTLLTISGSQLNTVSGTSRLTSKGTAATDGITITGSTLGDTTATAAKNISTNGVTAGNTTLTSTGGNIQTTDTDITGSLSAFAGNITLDSTTANSLSAFRNNSWNGANKVTIQNGSKFGTAAVYATNIDVKGAGTEVKGGRLTADGDLNIKESAKLSNMEYARSRYNGNTYVNNAIIENTEVRSDKLISVSNYSTLDNATLNGGSISVLDSYAVGNLIATAANGTLNLTNVMAKSETPAANATLTANTNGITIDNSTLGATTATATSGKLDVKNNSHLGTLIANANDIAVTGSETGSVALTSTTGIAITNSTIGDSIANTLTPGKTGLDAGTTIGIANSTVTPGSLVAKAGGNITAKGLTVTTGNASLTSTGGSIELSKYVDTNKSNSIAGNLTAHAATSNTIADTTVTNGYVDASGSSIDIDRLTANNSYLKAVSTGLVDIASSTLGSINESSAGTTFSISGSTVTNGTNALAGEKLTVAGSTLSGANSLTSTGSDIEISASNLGGTTATADLGNISILDDSTLASLIASAASISIADSSVTGTAGLTAANGITIDNSALGNTTATAGGKLDIKNNSSTGTLLAKANDISIANSTTGDFGLDSTTGISISNNSTLGNSIDNTLTTDTKKGLVAETTIDITDTTVKGNLTANAGSDITIKGLTTEKVKGVASGSVSLTSKNDISFDKSDTKTNHIVGSLTATSSQSTGTKTENITIDGVNGTKKTVTTSRGDVRINETEVGGKLTATANNVNLTNSSATSLGLKAIADTAKITTTLGTGRNKTTTIETVKTGGDIILDTVHTTGTADSKLTAENSINTKNTNILTNLITIAPVITLDSTSASSLIAAAAETTGDDGNLTEPSTKISIQNGSNFGTIRAYATDIDVIGNSQVRGGRLSATNDLNINTGAKLSNAEYAKAGHNAYVNNSTIDTSTVIANNELSVSNYSTLNNAILDGGSVSVLDSYAITNLIATAEIGDLNLTNVMAQSETPAANATLTATAGDINITNSTLGTTSATAGGDITIDPTTLSSLNATAVGDITIEDSTVTGDADLTSTNSSITLDNSDFGSISSAHAKNNINITNSSSVTGSTSALADNGNINIDSSTLGTSGLTATTGNVTVTGSTLGDTTATAGGNITVQRGYGWYGKKSVINSLIATASGHGSYFHPSISISDSTITNNANLTATNDGISLTNSNFGSVNATAEKTLTAQGITSGVTSLTSKNGSVNLSKYGYYYNTRNNSITGKLDIDAKTSATVEDTTVTNGNVDIDAGTYAYIEDILATNGMLEVNAGTNIDIKDANVHGNVIANAGPNGTNYINLDDLTTYYTNYYSKGDVTAITKGSVKVDDSTLAGTLTVKGSPSYYSPTGANKIEVTDTTAKNLNLKASANDTRIRGNGNITLQNVTTKGYADSTLRAANSIDMKNTTIEKASLIATAGSNIDAQGLDVQAGNANLTATNGHIDLTKLFNWYGSKKNSINGNLTTNSGTYTNIEDTTVNNATLTANAGTTINIEDTNVYGNVNAKAGSDITFDNLDTHQVNYYLRGNAKADSSNGNITTKNGTSIDGKLTTISKKDISLNDTTADELVAGANEYLSKASNNVSMNRSDFGTIRAYASDIDMNNSTASYANLRSNGDISIYNHSRIDNGISNAGADINIYDSSVSNNLLIATNNINIADESTLNDSIAWASGNINVTNSTVNNSTLDADRNITVRDSKIANFFKPFWPTMIAGGNIEAFGSELNNVNAKADGNITVAASEKLVGPWWNSHKEYTSSTVNNSTLNADENVNIQKSTVNGSALSAGSNINVTESNLTASRLDAKDNINVLNKSNVIASKLDAKDNINVAGSNVIVSKLNAKDNINVTDSNVISSTLNARNDINIKNGSKIIVSKLDARDDINISNRSNVIKSNLNARDDINIKNGSALVYSNAKAGDDINISGVESKSKKPFTKLELFSINLEKKSNGSTVIGSKLNARDDINVSDNSKVKQSKLYAGDDINVSNNSKVNNSIALAGDDINISKGSSARSVLLGAKDDINVTEGSKLNNAIALAGDDINITKGSNARKVLLGAKDDINISKGSSLNNSIALANDDINISKGASARSVLMAAGDNITVTQGSKLNNAIAIANNSIGIADSKVNNVALMALNNIYIFDTKATGELIAEAVNGDIDLINVYGKANTNLKGGDIYIDSSKIGDTTILAAKGVGIIDSTMNSADINAVKNVNITDSTVNTDIGISTNGNIALAGIYVGTDLNIGKANSVLISNSTSPSPEDYPTIAGLSAGMSPITDYDHTKFTDSKFDDIGLIYGPSYGRGNRISYIGGNTNISNVYDATIVNTAIIGNLTESNITTNANLITSYVGGDYTPYRTSIKDASVYKSYIKGRYTKYYPDNLLGNDVDKLKFGSPLDTAFRQQFNPRGFAASDDEIKLMKRNTLSSMTRGNGNSFRFNRGFRAY